MFTPTQSSFRNHVQPIPQSTPIKKGDVVFMQGAERIVMAVLQADTENPITYNVCNAVDLKGSLHGVTLDGATRIPTDSLSEIVRQRAKNFV